MDLTLRPPEHESIARHLENCEQCRQEADDLAKVMRVMRSVPRKEPVIDLWEEFTPTFEAIQNGDGACVTDAAPGLGISRVLNAIRDGWFIFINVVSISTRNKLQYLMRGTG
jgi:hypothetical protein